MPILVVIGASLIGYRATVHAGEELGEMATKALPWVAAGLAVWLIMNKRGR